MSGSNSQFILENLWLFLQDKKYTDVQIVLEDGQLPAHRAVLAAMSPFFDAMLSHDMREKSEGVVKLPTVKTSTWKSILSYYYTEQDVVTGDNVGDVLEAAEMMQLLALKDSCARLLMSDVSLATFFHFLEIAKKYNMPNVKQEVFDFIVKNFSAVSSREDFLNLAADEIAQVIANPDLSVESEEVLCEIVLGWMNANETDLEMETKLFSELRLHLLSAEYLFDHVMYHRCIVKNKVNTDRVRQELHLRFSSAHQQDAQPRGLCQTRRRGPPFDRDDAIFVMGWEGDGVRVYVWLLGERRWLTLPSPPLKIGYDFALTVFGSLVIVTGGYHENSHKSSVIFNFSCKEWTVGPNLVQGRRHHGMVVVNDSVYAIGGYRSGKLRSIERFSTKSGQWTMAGTLQVGVEGCGVVAVGDKILIVGGRGENDQNNLIQCFDTTKNTTVLADCRLPCDLTFVRGADQGDQAYFLGRSGDLLTIRVEPMIEVTEHIQLKDFGDRCDFGLYQEMDCLTVFGGYRNFSKQRDVESFDLRGGRQAVWTRDIEPLPKSLRVYGVNKIKLAGPHLT